MNDKLNIYDKILLTVVCFILFMLGFFVLIIFTV